MSLLLLLFFYRGCTARVLQKSERAWFEIAQHVRFRMTRPQTYRTDTHRRIRTEIPQLAAVMKALMVASAARMAAMTLRQDLKLSVLHRYTKQQTA